MNEIHRVALRLLTRREHSCFELRRKLQERGYSLDQINPELESLIEQGLLSDSRFAECYLRARAGKGYGPVRIEMELQQGGVAAEIIDETLDKADIDWLELAHRVRQKRFGAKVPTDFPTRARQMQFLQYRGFNTDQIKKILMQDRFEKLVTGE